MPRLETMSTTGLPVAGLITVFFCKFGIWRRFDLTFEWLTLFPVKGVLPVIMQTLLIEWGSFECGNTTGRVRIWQGLAMLYCA